MKKIALLINLKLTNLFHKFSMHTLSNVSFLHSASTTGCKSILLLSSPIDESVTFKNGAYLNKSISKMIKLKKLILEQHKF